MQKLRNKTMAIIITAILISTTVSLLAMPAANAHTPTWEVPSFAYLTVAPNPVGVGQRVSIMMWVDLPMPSAAIGNDVRRHDYKLTITKPNGGTEVMNWPIVSDTTGVQWLSYSPDQVGNYSFKFDYAGQDYTWSGNFQNDTMLPASASKILKVTEEQLPEATRSYPLPAEYWTRPIEGQNTDWYTISSNWLRGPYIRFGTSATEVTADISGRYQADGIAPNSAHVLWSKSLQDGGVVGGSRVGIEGNTYYMGGSYNVRFASAIVMYGRLFYQEPYGNSGGGGDEVAVDLRTGKELWRTNVTATGAPSFGYLYDFDSGNQHGVLPEGLLFTNSYARSYDPSTGIVTTMNVTSVPSGTEIVGAKGEILRYAVTNLGTTANPDWHLTQWNSSRVFGGGAGTGVGNWYSGSVNASLSANYDWNVSLPLINGGSWSIVRYAYYDKFLLLLQGSLGTGPRDNGAGANITMVSLRPDSIGQIMWTKYYAPAPENVTRRIIAVDPDENLFVTEDKETLRLTAFSLKDGSQIWTSKHAIADIDTLRTTAVNAYGKLYCAGFDGILYAYNLKDGSLAFTYGNGGPGNSTYAGLGTAYGVYPIFIDVVADGKVYLATTEHSPDSPWYKDSKYRAINATDGTELWTLMGWGTGMYAGGYDVVSDGIFVFANMYDMKVYAVGKGPSAITIDAPMNSQPLGSTLTIRGTILDVAAGTKQDELIARFPYGVPAVSDSSQGQWMEYLYMQKPRPTSATGVPITLSVVDSNGNYREIGKTTSNIDGFFSLNWKPDIEGQYTVYASFAGSESYWPSHAVTAFSIDPASSTLPPAATAQPSVADTYFVPAVIGLFVAIVAVGVLTMLMVRKRP